MKPRCPYCESGLTMMYDWGDDGLDRDWQCMRCFGVFTSALIGTPMPPASPLSNPVPCRPVPDDSSREGIATPPVPRVLA